MSKLVDKTSTLSTIIFLWVYCFGVIICTDSCLIEDSHQSLEMTFYTEKISLEYIPNDFSPKGMKEGHIKGFYKNLSLSEYRILSNSLKQVKDTLNLNDFLYYELIEKTIKSIYKEKTKKEQNLYLWFYLNKLGYDVRLTFLNSKIYLYAYIEEEIFDVPIIDIGGRKYVNLSYMSSKDKSPLELFYIIDFIANEGGRAFSLRLEQLPLLKSGIKTNISKFKYLGTNYHLKIQYDTSIVALLNDYPLMEEVYYLEVPLSSIAYKSLIPRFKKLVKGKTLRSSVEMMLAFTRNAFEYQDDNDSFGKSKPMIAEEVFYYKYSDCEDRSALFYTLVKEVLDLPMIIVAYPEHLTIGVELPKNINKPLLFEGRKYTICDPTGPSNTHEVGIYPENYQNLEYEVIGKYK